MRRILITVVVLFCIPTSAMAEPAQNAPSVASLRDSRPLLTWSIPTGERVNVIEVASSPTTTPDGEFYNENHVTGDALDGFATSWQPTSRLHAGDYWWHLQWYAEDFSTTGYTLPAKFTIPLMLSSARVGITQYSSIPDAYVTYSVVTNATSILASCKVMSGTKIVKATKDRTTINSPGQRASGQCDTTVPERYDGERLRAVVKIVAGIKAASATRAFTAR